jgi:hypothetical protein
MRKRIILVAFTVAGAVALAAPTPIQAFGGEWIAHILDYGAVAGKGAKAAFNAQMLTRLADEAANTAKTKRWLADIVKTPEAAAEADKAEAAAARAKQKADRAAKEAAEEEKASDEAAGEVVKETGKEAVDKAHESAADGVVKTNSQRSVLIAFLAIMLGAILFIGGIVSMLAPRYKRGEEKPAPFTGVEKAGVRFITTGERPGVWRKV